MPDPTTLHTILVAVCLGGLLCLGWQIVAWAWSLLTTLPGKIVALVLLIIAMLALVFGKV